MVMSTMISTSVCALALMSSLSQMVIPSIDSVFGPVWLTKIPNDSPNTMSSDTAPHPAAMHRRFLLEQRGSSTSRILESAIVTSLNDRGISSDNSNRISSSCRGSICEIAIVSAWNPSFDYSSLETAIAKSIDHVARHYNLRQMTIIRSEIIKERGRAFLVYIEKI